MIDKKLIIRLWKAQEKKRRHNVSVIARRAGCSRAWVRKVLTDSGLYRAKKGK